MDSSVDTETVPGAVIRTSGTPAARANFSCKKCEQLYLDLPTVCVRCPVCAAKRGFTRLYDAVNVNGAQHTKTQLVDKLVAPQMASAAHKAPSAGMGRGVVTQPGMAAGGMVDPVGRSYSQAYHSERKARQLNTIPVLGQIRGTGPVPGR